jgi:hypothetical protein
VSQQKQPTHGTDEFATENFPRKQTISDSQIVRLCVCVCAGFWLAPFSWALAGSAQRLSLSFELQVLKNE